MSIFKGGTVMDERSEKKAERKFDGSVFVGILLLGIGALFLLNNLDVFYIGEVWSFWPFLLVALGAQKISQGGSIDQVGSGFWLVFFGLWLYVSIEGIWGFGFEESWPALLIVWGLSMIWRSFGRPWPFQKKEIPS